MHIAIYILFLLLVLWLLAVWPGEGRRERMETFIRVPIAHRGFHDNAGSAPENSMAAFRRAVEKGYGIELDVRMTADGQLVTAHDRSMLRAAGCDRNVDDMTYSELRALPLFASEERVPRFREVLDMVDGRVPIIMEIKAETLKMAKRTSEDVMLLLDSYQGEICMESFHPAALLCFKRLRPQMLRGQLSERFSGYRFPGYIGSFILSCCIFNFLTKPDFIAYNIRHRYTLRFCLLHDLFHAVCAAWTVRSARQMSEAASSFEIFIFEGFEPEPGSAGETGTARGLAGGGRERNMRDVVRKQLLVSGLVQAVGFRYRAVHIAQSLGVTGFVRNLEDGRVEMEAQGSEEEIAALVKRLGEQRFIEITRVEERDLPVVPSEYEFKVRY